MPRQVILEKLRDAKKAHAKWVRRAKHLVENLPVNEDMIPLDSTECAFGNWLYSDGMKFKSLSNLNVLLNNIEKEHSRLHDAYLNIYRIYFVETKRGFFTGLILGARKEIKPEKYSTALREYAELKKVSNMLVLQLDRFEKALMVEDINAIKKCLA